MMNTAVASLIEEVIDSPLKLQLVLFFYENKKIEASTPQIAARVYRDTWSIDEALVQLANDGILSYRSSPIGSMYRYQPRPELTEIVATLYATYNEPMERDSVQTLVRDVALFAPYRRNGVDLMERSIAMM